MKVLITLRDTSQVVAETDKTLAELKYELLDDYITTSTCLVKSSEVICIEEVDYKSKENPTTIVVNCNYNISKDEIIEKVKTLVENNSLKPSNE